MSVQPESPFVPPQAVEVPAEQPTVLIHGSAEARGIRKPIDWSLEIPETLTHGGLTALLPGWGGIKRSSRAERHANTVRGRATLSFDPPRESESMTEDFFDPQHILLAGFERVYQDARQELATNRDIPHRKQIDTDRIVLSLHSMAGYAGTDWALKNPSKTEAVIYKAAAGFGTVNPFEDLDPLGFAKEVADYVLSGEIDLTPRNLFRIVNYYGRRPLHSAGEAKHCLTVDNCEKVAMLGHLSIPNGLVTFENDSVISAKKSAAKAAGVVDVIEELPGLGHLAPQRHAGIVADATWAMQQRLTTSRPTLRLV